MTLSKTLPAVMVLVLCALMSFAAFSLPLAYFISQGRSIPGITVGPDLLAAMTPGDVTGYLSHLDQKLTSQPLTFSLRGHFATMSLSEWGISLDEDATMRAVFSKSLAAAVTNNRSVLPELAIDSHRLNEQLAREFSGQITPPSNATINLTAAGKLEPVPAKAGEKIDLSSVAGELKKVMAGARSNPVELSVISTAPPIEDPEIESARIYAEQLLTSGLSLAFNDQLFELKPFTVKRLLQFIEQIDPANPPNHILAVRLEPEGFREYLATTIAPEINREAQNARFVVSGRVPSPAEATGESIKVDQFQLPAEGLTLNIDRTASHLASAMARQEVIVPLAVDVTKPDIASLDDIERLGITTLLASGESDFVGSTPSRAHNIYIGAARYHGLLIPPQTDFSFNEHLGPVTAAAGFKPELVIKEGVTTPEFGGGLCQVSTTVFRAALNSGLEITQRRNHSYAVRYYGTPGLDATIYPPYTDLRFHNNTPGYILIQHRIEGTKLTLEFWGTGDGREVIIDGPHPYDQQPDGAVKSVVKQTVNLNGESIINQSFYSNYKSPKLYPKVLSAEYRENKPPETSPAPKPTPQPTVKPGKPKPPPTETNEPSVSQPAEA